jgi:alpha-amylase/alpha-mannosidase (GH57 family)
VKDAYVTIHGHFYQPPRESPWLDVIEKEESASPYHDWNERIACECYRPNAHARIVDGQGKILNIINNYSHISFNFGPTLFRWFEKAFPLAYQRILEADRESLTRLGHGNAIGQTYNHVILPLANARDKETEILWGMADFERRFRRKAEALWLPETAVNGSTLQILAKHGMKFVLLSPFQALRQRPIGGTKWIDVSGGKIDFSQPYRFFVGDESGKKRQDRFIDIFFYDGAIAREISFGDLLRDGHVFCNRLIKAFQSTKARPQLIHLATDGETYGHHKKFGDMALAYTLYECLSSLGLEITNYGTFLGRFPPTQEVEIDEGPKGEGTSWSCVHGVGRWKEDCGCSTGGQAGWNQRWRKPLREALNFLRDELSLIFEREGEGVFLDPWEARNGYIDVILDRSPGRIRAFFEKFGLPGLQEDRKMRGLLLLEMERHILQMFTSCGWFFNDISGIETILILQHACRAVELAKRLLATAVEEEFTQRLSLAKSNLPEMGDGREIYRRHVKPRSVSLEQAVNHCLISSLYEDGRTEKKVFSYRMEKVRDERLQKDENWLVLGQVKLTPEMIPEAKAYLYVLIPSKKDILRTWIFEPVGDFNLTLLRTKGEATLGKNEEELAGVFASIPGIRSFTLRDVLGEERQSLLQKLIQRERDEHRKIYAELFDRTRLSIDPLVRMGLEVPFEIRLASEVTLSDRLLREVQKLRSDFKGGLDQGTIDGIIEEAGRYGCHLGREEPCSILSGMVNQRMRILRGAMANESSETVASQIQRIEELLTLIDRAEKWGFELRKGEAQNIMNELLDSTFGDLERGWWGWGSGIEKPIPPNLIVLAEKLGFNVDRFSKIKMPS